MILPNVDNDNNTTMIRTNTTPSTKNDAVLERANRVVLKLRSQRLQSNKKFESMKVNQKTTSQNDTGSRDGGSILKKRVEEFKKRSESLRLNADGKFGEVVNNDGNVLKKKIEEIEKRQQSFRLNKEKSNINFREIQEIPFCTTNEKATINNNENIEDDTEGADAIISKIHEQRAQSNWFNLKIKTKQSRIQLRKEIYEKETEKKIQAFNLPSKNDDDVVKQKIGGLEKRRQNYLHKLQEEATEVAAAAEKARAQRAAISAQIAAAERAAAEKTAAKRIAKEKAAPEKAESATARATAERIAAERAAAKKKIVEEKAAEVKAAEKSTAINIAEERATAIRIANEKAVAERIAAELAAAEKATTERTIAERIAAERAAAQKIAEEKAAAERAAAEICATRKKATIDNNENVKKDVERADAILSKLSLQRAQSNWFNLKMKTKNSKIKEQKEFYEKETETKSGESAVNNDGIVMKKKIDTVTKKKIEGLEKRRQNFRLNKEKSNDKFKSEKATIETGEIGVNNKNIKNNIQRADAILSKIRSQQAQSNWLKVKMKTKQSRIQEQKEINENEKEKEQRIDAFNLQRKSDDDAVKEKIRDLEKRRQAFMDTLQQKAAEEAAAAEKARAQSAAIAAERAIAMEKAAAERAITERIAAERAAGKKIVEEQAAAEKAVAKRIAAEKAATERAIAERIAAERAAAKKIAEEKAIEEKAAAERAAAKRIAEERATAKRIDAERAAAERAAVKRASAERIAAMRNLCKKAYAAERKRREEEEAARKISANTNFVVDKKKMRKFVKNAEAVTSNVSVQRSQVNEFGGKMLNIGASIRKSSMQYQKDNAKKDAIIDGMNYSIGRTNERTKEWNELMMKALLSQIRNHPGKLQRTLSGTTPAA